MRLNILYIIWSLSSGGAERVVINLVKGLDKTRFNPIVCCLNWAGEYAQELESRNIKVIALNKKRGIDISVINKLITVIKNNKIDIVHTHLWTSNFWGRIAAKLAGVPVIIASEHGVSRRRGFLRFFADRVLSCFSDRITFVSKNVKEEFARKVTYNQRKARVIHNGIDLAKFRQPVDNQKVREKIGIEEDDFVVSCIGRLSPEKGHKFLLKAFASLNGEGKLKLLVVGDGALRESLQSSALNYKLENRVIFTGFRKDISDILGITDLLVIPSTREAHSVVALEAFASGVPVVATDVGGMNEIIIDRYTGLLVSAKNPEQLGLAIEKLVKDKSLREQIGKLAKAHARSFFGLKQMVKETETLYLESYGLKAEKNVH